MKIKFAKIKGTFTGVLNYLASLGLALVFALYLSGRVGWFIMAAFISAPILSLLLTLPFISGIYAECELSADALSKGDTGEFTVTLGNARFLPTPPVIVEMFDSPCARAEVKKFTISLLPFSEDSFTAVYRARIAGEVSIGVRSLTVTDFFGIFSFDIKSADTSALVGKLAVIPDIAEVAHTDAHLRRAAELSAQADDSEDTSESSAVAFGGFPGYDSREYVPGDPLKRINWKQSAKRGKLLVRLDDEAMCSAVAVVLDSVFCADETVGSAFLKNNYFMGCPDDELAPLAAQYAVEGALGYVKAFLDRKYSVTFMFMGENGWEIYNVADESELTLIRTALSRYKFSSERGRVRFPAEVLAEQKGSVSIFCTPYADRELFMQAGEYMGDSAGKGALSSVLFAAALAPSAEDREDNDI